MKEKVSLQGVFDMHIHTAPDVIPRTYTDFQLVDAAAKAGARGIVIKAHHGSTVTRAYLCNLYNRKTYGDNGLTIYGGVVLNRDVGGLNLKAVETAVRLGGKEVWLPTIDAKNDREKEGKPGGITVVDEKGAVKPEVIEIMKLVRDHDIVLSTGHISPEEIFKVAEAAREMGLKKIVITHPEFWIVGLTLSQQKKLVDEYDVIMERCYKQPLMDHTWKDNCPANLEAVREVGCKNTMIDTDSGQPVNPPWEKALAYCIGYLSEHGVSQEAIHHMTQDVPAWLLGLRDRP